MTEMRWRLRMRKEDIDIHHIESHESSWIICKKLHRIHVDYDPGVIALISGPSTAYGPILTKFSRCGWHVQLFHPENAPKDYIDYGDHNWPVERLLGSEIEDINKEDEFERRRSVSTTSKWNVKK
ncbi:hypothetical protein DINM_004068 [Dirofilaria immitis]|nr:hypothetical protein [Dirofilaria immitis]